MRKCRYSKHGLCWLPSSQTTDGSQIDCDGFDDVCKMHAVRENRSKCLTHNCGNHDDEGDGTHLIMTDGQARWICAPCLKYLTTGSRGNSAIEQDFRDTPDSRGCDDVTISAVGIDRENAEEFYIRIDKVRKVGKSFKIIRGTMILQPLIDKGEK